MSNNIFYVYGLYEEGSNVPFYIGKGHGTRKDVHIREAQAQADIPGNQRIIKVNKILKLLSEGKVIESRIIEEGLSEKTAFERERELIIEYGRVDLGTGPLTNMSDGGEGNKGAKWKKSSRDKIKGRVANNRGIPHKEETKRKIGKKAKERFECPDYKERLSRSLRGKANFKDKDGNILRLSTDDPRVLSGEFVGLTKGYEFTEEHKRKISEAGKGRPGPMRGKKHSEESIKVMSEKKKGKKRYGNFKLLKIIYCRPEELSSLVEDPEDWYPWVPAYGFHDKSLRAKYPKALFYPPKPEQD